MADVAESSDAWLSVSALARLRGVDKAAISRKVARLAAAGDLTTRAGAHGTKLVNRAEFDRVAEMTTDAIQTANGRRRAADSPVAAADMGDVVGPVLSHQQARKTQISADIAQLQLDELRGSLVRVADISAGAAVQGETLARRIDQMLPEWADDLAAVVAKDGTAGLRAALKGKARELRGALAEAFAALATPAREDGNRMVELETEAA
jgi:hypothetical protein